MLKKCLVNIWGSDFYRGLPQKKLFWAFLKFEAKIQYFKGFGADEALKFNILRGLEASVVPNPLKC